MTNTIASTLNTIDTIATVGERTLKVTATVLWFATVAAVAVTGLCINSTAVAREAYAQQTIDLAQNADEIAAFNDAPIALLPAAAEVAPVVTFEAFVTQVLHTATIVPDLGPELDGNVIASNMAAAIAPLPTLTITEADEPLLSWSYDELMTLKAKELKAMAKEQGLKGYGSMRKADLAMALTV